MEKIKVISTLRDLAQCQRDLEVQLQKKTGMDLNQAMVICALGGEVRLPSEISKSTGLLPAHTSKILASLERLDLIERNGARKDRRQVLCNLTKKGLDALKVLKNVKLTYPEMLAPMFNK